MLKKIFLAVNLFVLMVTEVFASATQVAEKIPFKSDSSDIGGHIQKTILVFLLIALLAYFLIYGLKIFYNKKYNLKNTGDNLIKITDHRYLTKRLSIICLQIDDVLYTFAQTHNELVILEKKTISENEKESSSKTFSDS